MTDDRKPRNDDLAERWLDSALDRYTDAEPRPGFETRLLASVAAERSKRPRWNLRWHWIAIAATAAVAIAVLALSIVHRHEHATPRVAQVSPAHVQGNGV